MLNEISNLSEENIYEKYGYLGDILRLPKPVYLKGLTTTSQDFLIKRKQELNLINRQNEIPFALEPIFEPITFEEVDLLFISNVQRTKRTNMIQEAFGINPEYVESLIFHNLNLTIEPGNIFLVTGASGSGKTTLLKLITGEIQPTEGTISIPQNAKIGNIKTITSNLPLVEEVGETIDTSLSILNTVGLSDFGTYLLSYEQLSKGQQYRALLAKLIDSKSNVWIMDDFLDNLDNITSLIIANNIQKIARKLGITVIAASCKYEHYIDAFKPDKILFKEYGWTYKIFNKSINSDCEI